MDWKKQGIYLLIASMALLVGRWWGSQTKSTPQSDMSYVRCGPTELGYSCSMHPQLRVRDSGDCPFCQMPMVKETVLPGNKDYVVLTDAAAALADIQTSLVTTGQSGSGTIKIAGKISPAHDRVFTQVASLPGRIEKLYAQRPGQWIEKGQPIARIYSKELISAVEAFRRPNTPESLRLSARNNLKEWQVPQKIFEELVAAEDHRQAIDIYATASGVVKTLEAHVGEQAVNTIMGAPTTLYTLVDLSKVWVNLSAQESQIQHLREGQEVRVQVDAFPSSEFSGKVISLAAEMDEGTRSLPVIVELANPRGDLRPGMLARAEVKLNSPGNNVVTIPRTAALWTGRRSVVFVLTMTEERNEAYQMREVQLGQLQGDTYEVLSGLEAGEELVTNGVFTLDAAAQLQGVPSMMNRPKQSLRLRGSDAVEML